MDIFDHTCLHNVKHHMKLKLLHKLQGTSIVKQAKASSTTKYLAIAGYVEGALAEKHPTKVYARLFDTSIA